MNFATNGFELKPHPFMQQTTRKYSEDAKRRLLANLDIELADRIRRFEHGLSDALARFRSQQESQIVRIPKAVRSITMREFGDRYQGDVQRCLQGLQRRKQGDEPESITPAVRKRKWQEANEALGDSGRQSKTARTTPSPQKAYPKTNVSTPKTNPRPPLQPHGQFLQQRVNSPARAPHPLSNQHRPPSAALFNPELPSAPQYPSGRPTGLDHTAGRLGPNVHGTRRESNIVVKKGSFMLPTKGSHKSRGTVTVKNKQEDGVQVHLAPLIIVPTIDGDLLEFDPFNTTPTEIDNLEDVSENAKKQAKKEVIAFISTQMAKWTIGS